MTGKRATASPGRDGKRVRHERSAGGIVFRRSDGSDERGTSDSSDERGTTNEHLFLVIRDGYGNWGFSKGHLERRERSATAALREVMEETGLRSLKLVGAIATIEWYFRLHGNLIHKRCEYFLMETDTATTKPQESEGITACRWATLSEARDLVRYDNAREVLQRAHDMIAAAQMSAPQAR